MRGPLFKSGALAGFTLSAIVASRGRAPLRHAVLVAAPFRRLPPFVSSRREAAVRDEYATFDFPKCEKNVVDGSSTSTIVATRALYRDYAYTPRQRSVDLDGGSLAARLALAFHMRVPLPKEKRRALPGGEVRGLPTPVT